MCTNLANTWLTSVRKEFDCTHRETLRALDGTIRHFDPFRTAPTRYTSAEMQSVYFRTGVTDVLARFAHLTVHWGHFVTSVRLCCSVPPSIPRVQ